MHPLLAQCLRLTVGTADENRAGCWPPCRNRYDHPTSLIELPPNANPDRVAEVSRQTAETRIRVQDQPGRYRPEPPVHGHRLLRPHARPDRPPRVDRPGYRGGWRPALTATTPWKTWASPGPGLPQGGGRQRRAFAATATPMCRWTRRAEPWWWIFRPPRPGDGSAFTSGMIGGLRHPAHPLKFFQGLRQPRPGDAAHRQSRGDNAHHQVRPCSKPLVGHCAWRWSAMRVRLGSIPDQGRLGIYGKRRAGVARRPRA